MSSPVFKSTKFTTTVVVPMSIANPRILFSVLYLSIFTISSTPLFLIITIESSQLLFRRKSGNFLIMLNGMLIFLNPFFEKAFFILSRSLILSFNVGFGSLSLIS